MQWDPHDPDVPCTSCRPATSVRLPISSEPGFIGKRISENEFEAVTGGIGCTIHLSSIQRDRVEYLRGTPLSDWGIGKEYHVCRPTGDNLGHGAMLAAQSGFLERSGVGCREDLNESERGQDRG